MTKTAKKRKVDMPAGIRNKLMAAVSMLLVSSIMLVSTTYAWFTLSTAPEVKGITTNVGANGNLEMMLLNADSYASTDENLGVESNIGDSSSVQAVTTANETWGNLVDLSDASYGLGNIVLTPAKLNLTGYTTSENVTTAGTKVASSTLLAPSYGNDGRVIDVSTATYTGQYTGGKWVYNDSFAGVRAIGTSSGVTQRLAAYRTASSAVTSNITSAKNKARASLNENGQELANILVGHVQGVDNYTRAQVEALGKMITSLGEANNAAGDAIKSAVLAYSLSAANTAELTDDQVTKMQSDVAAATVANVISVDGIITPPAGVTEAITQWTANNTSIFGDKSKDPAVEGAKTKYDALMANKDKTTFTYNEISGIVDSLVDKTHTTIAGVKNPSKNNLQTIINYFTKNGRIDIVMEDGSGIYADIAKLIGDYTVSGLTVHVEYNDISADAPISMSTTGHDTALINNISTGNAPAATTPSAGSTVTLSDTYGYALDFGFRTNAAASNLQLQTAAKQRVYEGTENDPGASATQGSGSYMEFKSNNVTTFSVDEVRALMSAIRVAFVAPSTDGSGTYDMLGLAALNITSSTDNTTGITSYTGGTVLSSNDGLKADLYMYNYTQNADGDITLGDMKADQSSITALSQNIAKKVTAIVYLDGNLVDNTMVANATTSMTGKMNLQFSSSATLQAMENSGMRNGGNAAGAVNITYTEFVTAGQSFTNGTITGTVKAGYTIYKGSDNNYYFSQNGTSYTRLNKGNATTALTITGN